MADDEGFAGRFEMYPSTGMQISALSSKGDASVYGADSCPRRPHQREVGSQKRILLHMPYPIRMLNLPGNEAEQQHLLRH